jgi:hypothetical protein
MRAPTPRSIRIGKALSISNARPKIACLKLVDAGIFCQFASCCARSRTADGRGDDEMRRAQLSFGDGLIVDEVSDLREDWMQHADQVLADEQIVAAVYEALLKRHPKSRCRGRLGTPAEVSNRRCRRGGLWLASRGVGEVHGSQRGCDDSALAPRRAALAK